MLVKALTCPRCGCTVFSRAHHDFRYCPCKGIAVDGGFQYLKVSWAADLPAGPPEAFGVEVNATQRELYDDWNTRADKWGVFPPGAILTRIPLKE